MFLVFRIANTMPGWGGIQTLHQPLVTRLQWQVLLREIPVYSSSIPLMPVINNICMHQGDVRSRWGMPLLGVKPSHRQPGVLAGP